MQYLRFTNFGKVAIQRNDLASADALRVEVKNGRVLDMSVSGVKRDVCAVALGELHHHDEISTATVSFDFLDHLDGALIQIITDTPAARGSLKGTIVGMPQGIMTLEESKRGIKLPDVLEWLIPLLLEVGAIATVPFAFRYIMGSWSHWWVLFVPIVAIIAPLIVTLPVIAMISDGNDKRRSLLLAPPDWYHWRHIRMAPEYVFMSREASASPGEVSGASSDAVS